MMRCLMKLRALKDQAHANANVKVQGVVYRMLEDAGYDDLHDKQSFKFLTFSNIFPPHDMQAGDDRTFIVASPSRELIESVANVARQWNRFEPGDQQYAIESVSEFAVTPEDQGRMITGTPIVVRLAREKAEEYGIDPEHYDRVFWKLSEDHPADAFIDRIEENLAHKYEEYYDRDAPDRPYFTGFEPRKEVAVPLDYADKRVPIIGTTWELDYEAESRPMQRLMSLAYSTGVGELNTTGFGFVNKMDTQSEQEAS